MTDAEAKETMVRVCKFRELETLEKKAYAALESVTRDDPDGPHGQGPFTGNHRETRQVLSMSIRFSVTRGGSPAVETTIHDMSIEAHRLGDFLAKELRDRLDTIRAEMEKI